MQERLFHNPPASSNGADKETGTSTGTKKDSLVQTDKESENRIWGWSWLVDGEHPPPSSIVSRRDTAEARKLARIADITVEQEESKLSGNRLWTVLVNFLSTRPNNKGKEDDDDETDELDEAPKPKDGEPKEKEKEDVETAPGATGSIIKRLKSIGGARV